MGRIRGHRANDHETTSALLFARQQLRKRSTSEEYKSRNVPVAERPRGFSPRNVPGAFLRTPPGHRPERPSQGLLRQTPPGHTSQGLFRCALDRLMRMQRARRTATTYSAMRLTRLPGLSRYRDVDVLEAWIGKGHAGGLRKLRALGSVRKRVTRSRSVRLAGRVRPDSVRTRTLPDASSLIRNAGSMNCQRRKTLGQSRPGSVAPTPKDPGSVAPTPKDPGSVALWVGRALDRRRNGSKGSIGVDRVG